MSAAISRCSRAPNLEYRNHTLSLHMGPWIDLPVRPYTGDGARYRVVGDLYARAQRKGTAKWEDAVGQDLLVLQVERRNAGLMDIYTSTYTSQILIGGLIDDLHSAELLILETSSVQGLWCTGCFTDDMYGSGRGAVIIPLWTRRRYFSALRILPACITCGLKPQVFRTDEPKDEGRTHLFSSVCNTELQSWVEAELAPHGIAPAAVTWAPGPASTPPFQEELVATAFCPERAARIVELGGKAALRDMMGCAEWGSGPDHPYQLPEN